MPGEGGKAEHGLTQRRQERMRGALLRIIEPVRQEVEEIDERLAVIEVERQDLLSARREAMTVIRAADPAERAKHDGSKARAAKAQTNGAGSPPVGEETRTTVIEFLRKHAGEFPEGFDTPVLTAHPGLQLEKTTIGRALEHLADEGLIRLDRIGKFDPSKKGRRTKIYKLTEAGEK